ncbi:hypothetical protein J6590_022567 [Homalodisca vitripennis]|nr:hypothetical protein J6590_022567 [Homalodisca vitripennis]
MADIPCQISATFVSIRNTIPVLSERRSGERRPSRREETRLVKVRLEICFAEKSLLPGRDSAQHHHRSHVVPVNYYRSCRPAAAASVSIGGTFQAYHHMDFEQAHNFHPRCPLRTKATSKTSNGRSLAVN